jgi:hypothetical protein
MKLVITTQHYENYAWSEDGTVLGTGADAYWKAKGGSEFMVENVPLNIDYETVIDMVRHEVDIKSDGFISEIIGWSIESDDYMSWFEKSQLEYDGAIAYPEPRVDYADLKMVFDHEYSEWCADMDAEYYGAAA